MQTIILLTHHRRIEQLLGAVSAALMWQVQTVHDLQNLATALQREPKSDILLDLHTLFLLGANAEATLAELKAALPESKIALIASRAHWLHAADQLWGHDIGADVIIPCPSALRWAETGGLLAAAMLPPDRAHEAERRVKPYLKLIQNGVIEHDADQLIYEAQAMHINLPKAHQLLSDHHYLEADRTYHFKRYTKCFVAKEAHEFLATQIGGSALAATLVGRALQAADFIYHVAFEREFAAEHLFFRTSALANLPNLNDCLHWADQNKGFEVSDKLHLGKRYPQCFTGHDAVQRIMKRGFEFNEALSVGQRLFRLSQLQHVTDEHMFKDQNLYYRFAASA
jgi:Domain found in Dishevelled, Egl-10, and Pleckstrin (DEP)